jgi:hypothetical protein
MGGCEFVRMTTNVLHFQAYSFNTAFHIPEFYSAILQEHACKHKTIISFGQELYKRLLLCFNVAYSGGSCDLLNFSET